MKPREAMQRLRREGWDERPSKGAHILFTKGERVVVVSGHTRDIPTGTLRAICRQAGWGYPPRR